MYLRRAPIDMRKGRNGLAALAREVMQRENAQLKSERTHYCERVVRLEEELRWIKSQYFGTSSQKTDAAAVNPDQAMLFNEIEALAAIEAAEEAQRESTTKVEAHERQHTGGRKAIPKHFPRIEIPHDLLEDRRSARSARCHTGTCCVCRGGTTLYHLPGNRDPSSVATNPSCTVPSAQLHTWKCSVGTFVCRHGCLLLHRCIISAPCAGMYASDGRLHLLADKRNHGRALP